MNVLVTGGAGFIGSLLIKKLLELGNKVICIDNFSNGTEENILEFRNHENFKLYVLDINNTNSFLEQLKEEKIDMVYHLAANSDIQKGGQVPTVDYENTFQTTFSVLELMRQKGIKNLFFSSTSAVYGEKTNELLKENVGDLKPISYYGGAKLASEAYISSYAYMNDFNVLIFRFPNVIGPNLTHGVIYDFLNRLKENSSYLRILGDGTQTKPYIYALDLIDAIIKFSGNIEPGVTIYNVGVETATSVTTIANIICEELGLTNVEYEYTGGNIGWKGDIPTFKYDLSKIHSQGWKAIYTSNEAVRETVRNMVNKK